MDGREIKAAMHLLLNKDYDDTESVGSVGSRAGELDGIRIEDGRIYEYGPAIRDPVPGGTAKKDITERVLLWLAERALDRVQSECYGRSPLSGPWVHTGGLITRKVKNME